MSIILSDIHIKDPLIRWKSYKYGDNIVSQYAYDEWLKIASDVYSEEELNSLLTLYPNKIQGFVLYDNRSSTPIAFVYLLNESKEHGILSFHGGGWGKSLRLTLLYMRGAILLIEFLLGEGFKVHTYCDKENRNAYKFMHGLGFVRYRTIEGRIYQWVNLQRLHNSKVYKYIFKH